MEKVTVPDKIVTDEIVLRELARQGIDKDYVEFTDYGAGKQGISPYMKGYKDLKSGLRIGVASGLPMCDRYGHRVELPWVQSNGTFRIQYNLFDAKVEGTGVTLVCLADQPDRTRLYDQVIWHPQLFIGGSEVHPIKDVAKLLEVDPINPDLLLNTLEWDYGVCKRRIRVIQGRFRERWVFSTNPNTDVRIKHNLAGSLKMKLGYAQDAELNSLKVTIIGDEEIIEASEFDNKVFPVEIEASLTVNPSAGQVSPVDGAMERFVGGSETWAEIISRDATTVYPSTANTFCVLVRCDNVDSNKYDRLYRSDYLYDTSPLGAAAVISDVVHSIRASSKADSGSFAPEYNIYASNPANDNDLVLTDMTLVSSTPFTTAVPYGGWDVGGGFTDFTFIQAGKDAIAKTGISRFCLRDATYDVAGVAPTPWGAGKLAYVNGYFADQGAGFKPKLVVTYSFLHELWRVRIGGVTYGVNLTDLT